MRPQCCEQRDRRGAVGLAYTNRLTTAALVQAAQSAASAARSAPVASAPPTVKLTAADLPVTQRARLHPGQVPTAAKVALLRRADEAARAHHPAIRGVSAIHVGVDPARAARYRLLSRRGVPDRDGPADPATERVTLLGHGLAALSAVDAVASDLAFTQALCGKHGQWIPVSYGVPTLRIVRLMVAGRG